MDEFLTNLSDFFYSLPVGVMVPLVFALFIALCPSGPKSGKIIRHSHWASAEQLPAEDFRLSRRRLGPGERADGVVMFERPPYKQSNETLFLQVAEAGAVDRPALAPIGFGISISREESGDGRRRQATAK